MNKLQQRHEDLRVEVEMDLKVLSEIISACNILELRGLAVKLSSLQLSIEDTVGNMDTMLEQALNQYSDEVAVERKTKGIVFAVVEAIKHDTTGLLQQF